MGETRAIASDAQGSSSQLLYATWLKAGRAERGASELMCQHGTLPFSEQGACDA